MTPNVFALNRASLLLSVLQCSDCSKIKIKNSKESQWGITIHLQRWLKWIWLRTSNIEEQFPGGASDKEPTCQCRWDKKCRFDPWVGKISWRRKWQATPVFLPGKPHGPEEPGRPQSIRSQRVRHNWRDLACVHENMSSYCGFNSNSLPHVSF